MVYDSGTCWFPAGTMGMATPLCFLLAINPVFQSVATILMGIGVAIQRLLCASCFFPACRLEVCSAHDHVLEATSSMPAKNKHVVSWGLAGWSGHEPFCRDFTRATSQGNLAAEARIRSPVNDESGGIYLRKEGTVTGFNVRLRLKWGNLLHVSNGLALEPESPTQLIWT